MPQLPFKTGLFPFPRVQSSNSNRFGFIQSDLMYLPFRTLKPRKRNWCTTTHQKNPDITESIERRIHCSKKRVHAKNILKTRTASKLSGSEHDEITIYFETNHYTRERTSFKLWISLRSMLTEWSARDLFTETRAKDALDTLFLRRKNPMCHISFLQRSHRFSIYLVEP